jgi:hypothetical protein
MSHLPPPPVPDGPLFKWLQEHKGFDRLRHFLRRLRPWQDKDMNVYDVFRFFILGLVNGSVATRAAAISFRLFVAFFSSYALVVEHCSVHTFGNGRSVAQLGIFLSEAGHRFV